MFNASVPKGDRNGGPLAEGGPTRHDRRDAGCEIPQNDGCRRVRAVDDHGLLRGSAGAQAQFGVQGGEAAPDRRQQWAVPSPDTATDSPALLYRPAGDGPFRLAVIAHASTQNALRRAQMPQPDYGALASALVARGFAVLVPERPGHGATGGRYLEDQGGCDDADYVKAGRATAAAIRVAIDFMRTQPFIRNDGVLVVGHSAGGWGALALAASDPKRIARSSRSRRAAAGMPATGRLRSAPKTGWSRPPANSDTVHVCRWHGWWRRTTAIFRRRCRNGWRQRFAATAARSISGCCRHLRGRPLAGGAGGGDGFDCDTRQRFHAGEI